RSGEGVVGARVRCGVVALAETDRGGAFRMEALPPGRQLLEVSADGYAPRLETVDLFGSGSPSLEIFLEASARVSGQVVDGARRPVAGASVFVEARRLRNGVAGASSAPRGQSGGDGHFAVSAPVGPARAFAAAAGRAASPPLDLDLAAGQAREVTLRLA